MLHSWNYVQVYAFLPFAMGPSGVACGASSVPSSSEGLVVSVPLLAVSLQSTHASADCMETPGMCWIPWFLYGNSSTVVPLET